MDLSLFEYLAKYPFPLTKGYTPMWLLPLRFFENTNTLFMRLGTKTTVVKESKPSLVVEMYKAHKANWCPLIEIED